MENDFSPSAKALAAEISLEVEVVVNRILQPAQRSLTPSELAFILFKLTADLARGGALYAMRMKLDEKSPEEIYDFCTDSLNKMIAGRKDQVVQKYHELAKASDNG